MKFVVCVRVRVRVRVRVVFCCVVLCFCLVYLLFFFCVCVCVCVCVCARSLGQEVLPLHERVLALEQELREVLCKVCKLHLSKAS